MRFIRQIWLFAIVAGLPALWMLDVANGVHVDKAVPPIHPVRVMTGGVAVVEIGFDPIERRTSTRALDGEPPFSTAALDSLMRWKFSSSGASRSKTSVTFLFRPRSFFKSAFLSKPIDSREPTDSPALPAEITDPGYPMDSSVKGVVILELKISMEGEVTDVLPLLQAPMLTELAANEVRHWKFSPAKVNDHSQSSNAFVVISFVDPLS